MSKIILLVLEKVKKEPDILGLICQIMINLILTLKMGLNIPIAANMIAAALITLIYVWTTCRDIRKALKPNIPVTIARSDAEVAWDDLAATMKKLNYEPYDFTMIRPYGILIDSHDLSVETGHLSEENVEEWYEKLRQATNIFRFVARIFRGTVREYKTKYTVHIGFKRVPSALAYSLGLITRGEPVVVWQYQTWKNEFTLAYIGWRHLEEEKSMEEVNIRVQEEEIDKTLKNRILIVVYMKTEYDLTPKQPLKELAKREKLGRIIHMIVEEETKQIYIKHIRVETIAEKLKQQIENILKQAEEAHITMHGVKPALAYILAYKLGKQPKITKIHHYNHKTNEYTITIQTAKLETIRQQTL